MSASFGYKLGKKVVSKFLFLEGVTAASGQPARLSADRIFKESDEVSTCSINTYFATINIIAQAPQLFLCLLQLSNWPLSGYVNLQLIILLDTSICRWLEASQCKIRVRFRSVAKGIVEASPTLGFHQHQEYSGAAFDTLSKGC